MNLLNNPLEGFSPELYLATLSDVAHADGLQSVEEELLRQQARTFGLDLDALPAVSDDLSHLPWSTRVLVYRDALMLAFADSDTLSPEEQQHLAGLAERMRIPTETVDAVKAWVLDYGALLDRLTSLIQRED